MPAAALFWERSSLPPPKIKTGLSWGVISKAQSHLNRVRCVFLTSFPASQQNGNLQFLPVTSGHCPSDSVSLQNQGVQLDHFPGLSHLSCPVGRTSDSVPLHLAPKRPMREQRWKQLRRPLSRPSLWWSVLAGNPAFLGRGSGLNRTLNRDAFQSVWLHISEKRRHSPHHQHFRGGCADFGCVITREKEGFAGRWHTKCSIQMPDHSTEQRKPI